MALREVARAAVFWSAGFHLFRDVLQFGVMLVLVRLLNPEDYGRVSLAQTVIGLLGVLSFKTVVVHLFQIRDERRVDYQQHFTAGAVLNGGCFVITNVIAAALFFSKDYSSIAPLLHLLSVGFLLEVPIALRDTMLKREHRWARLRTIHGIGLLVT